MAWRQIRIEVRLCLSSDDVDEEENAWLWASLQEAESELAAVLMEIAREKAVS
jgi:hypothetical protein